jgi:Tfp pilus assembly protein FimT
MTEALQTVLVVVIVLSMITLWPLLREWLALRRVASDANRLHKEAEQYRTDKLREIAESRSADKVKLRARDAVIVKAIADRTKEANLQAAVKKKLVDELNELNQTIGVSRQSIAESLAKIELLVNAQNTIREDSDAIHVLRNRIAELEVTARNNHVESAKLKLKFLELEKSKSQLLDIVSSTERDLSRIVSAAEKEADAKAAVAQRNEEIREYERTRARRLDEGIPVHETLTNPDALEKYYVKAHSSTLSKAEFAKVYSNGTVFALNETLLAWEKFGQVDSQYKASLESLFSGLREREKPMIVRCRLSVRPGEVYLPAKRVLSLLDE